ncbi:MAG: hypothetical protein ACTSQJ_18650, partial [Promethearchaeota archaeon]
MEFYPQNLIYFIIVFPIVIIALMIIFKLKKNRKYLEIIIILSILLFFIRFALTFFQETIGIMPYLIEDVIFYGLLMIFGLCFTWFYAFKIENVNFEDIRFNAENK